MKKVLWIEDGAYTEVPHLAGPVINSGKYLLHIAPNATKGLKLIGENIYMAIVIDIRLSPGQDQNLQKIYRNHNEDIVESRLGLVLLRFLLSPTSSILSKDNDIPNWIDKNQIAVLTVEPFEMLEGDFNKLELDKQIQYKEKILNADREVLLKLYDSLVYR